MDTNEQALVQVAAAPLAAPSAAVAGLVAASIAPNTKRSYEAALKRLDAALEGQDLTDASLSVYIASLHAAGLSPAVASMAVASVKFRCRLQGLASLVGPAVSQRHPPYHPQPGGRCRHRGPGIRSQSPGWWRAIAGSRRGLDRRDADGGQVAVKGTKDQFDLFPGFGPGEAQGPIVPARPLALYDLGGSGAMTRGGPGAAPLALRIFVETVLSANGPGNSRARQRDAPLPLPRSGSGTGWRPSILFLQSGDAGNNCRPCSTPSTA